MAYLQNRESDIHNLEEVYKIGLSLDVIWDQKHIYLSLQDKFLSLITDTRDP